MRIERNFVVAISQNTSQGWIEVPQIHTSIAVADALLAATIGEAYQGIDLYRDDEIWISLDLDALGVDSVEELTNDGRIWSFRQIEVELPAAF